MDSDSHGRAMFLNRWMIWVTVMTMPLWVLLADPGRAAETAAAFAEAGLDLGIIYFPPPHTPADLESHAEVLRDLAD